MTFFRSTPPFLVIICITLHLFWAAIILIDSQGQAATAVSALLRVLPDQYLPLILLGTASLATLGVMCRFPWNVLCLLPQQAILFISATGALGAILAGHYADGTIRPMAMIAADQIHTLLLTAAHAGTIIVYGVYKS